MIPHAANSDTPIIALPAPLRAPSRSSSLSWRLLVIGGWTLFIGGFAIGQPDDETLRHWWVDGAWTITYLATTVLSLWAAITLKGRDRMAWSFFAAASGAWFIAQLIWDYYELLADISTPFPALSDLFYLLFAPLYAVGLMFFGEKPKGASIGPKLVSQLVMIGAAVYAAVGLHVSEAIVTSGDGPLYLATAVAYPLFYDAAFLMGVLSLCLYVWGPKRFVLTLLVIGLACHASAETLYGLSLLGREYEVGQAYDFLWLLGGAFQFWAAAEHIHQARMRAGEEPLEEQFLIAAYSRARRLEPLVPALGIVVISLTLAVDADGLTRTEALDGADAGLLRVRDRGGGGGRLELARRGRLAPRRRRRGAEGEALRKPPCRDAGDRADRDHRDRPEPRHPPVQQGRRQAVRLCRAGDHRPADDAAVQRRARAERRRRR